MGNHGTAAADVPDRDDRGHAPAPGGAQAEGGTVEIAPGERSGGLAARLGAAGLSGARRWTPATTRHWPAWCARRTGAGTLTLVALDDVPAAQRSPAAAGQAGRLVLLHAQLRGTQRAARVADVLNARADLIVVAAGEAASGLDLTAALVVAEAAPWPSMVRRIDGPTGLAHCAMPRCGGCHRLAKGGAKGLATDPTWPPRALSSPGSRAFP